MTAFWRSGIGRAGQPIAGRKSGSFHHDVDLAHSFNGFPDATKSGLHDEAVTRTIRYWLLTVFRQLHDATEDMAELKGLALGRDGLARRSFPNAGSHGIANGILAGPVKHPGQIGGVAGNQAFGCRLAGLGGAGRICVDSSEVWACCQFLSAADQSPAMWKALVSRYSSIPLRAPSRPSPDCFTPPKGETVVETEPVFSPTIPNSKA